ncbi:2-phospho-L-lactate guanylyltransferase [Novosphingobium aquae]|uniref:3-phospho-D-glycerate guanylyltransferase n=1 Tax=Novosphingobium aquae TaxID=3133435 RepID=A0ABU8S978_9SPHN
MTCSIVIPVRPPEEGKSRLASVLSPHARAALVERMFRHVLDIAVASVPTAQVYVVSRSPFLLNLAEQRGARPVREESSGLNPALEQATALCDPELPLLVLSADLPVLTPSDIAALLDALDQADVVAATDIAGSGTNALLLRRPGLIAFAFGPDSLTRHHAATDSASLRFSTIRPHGLASDVDLPADLALTNAPDTLSYRQTNVMVSNHP